MDLKIRKILRPIEILFIVMNKTERSVFRSEFFSYVMNTGLITIERDLKYLRSLGIDIHSAKNKGLEIFGRINENIIDEFLGIYAGINFNLNLLLVKQCSIETIMKLALLNISAVNGIRLLIKTCADEYEFCPAEFIFSGNWGIKGLTRCRDSVLYLNETVNIKFYDKTF